MAANTALIVIDVQSGLLYEEPTYNVDGLLQTLSGLIERARTAETPVIYIQHCASSEEDTIHPSRPGWAIAPRIAPLPGELVVQKRFSDSFQETTLQQELESRDIKNLVVVGMQTDFCVDTTCRRAFSLDYKVTLVSDGHTTMDNAVLTAPQIIAHHNYTLGGGFAKLKPASEIEF